MLRALKAFLAVVRHGTFERAGSQTGLTQSAVLLFDEKHRPDRDTVALGNLSIATPRNAFRNQIVNLA